MTIETLLLESLSSSLEMVWSVDSVSLGEQVGVGGSDIQVTLVFF